MKKLSLVLVVILVFGLTGCNKSYTNVAPANVIETNTTDSKDMGPEEGAKLTIWEDSDTRIAYMEYVAEKFTEKYGIEVKVQKVVDYTSRMVQDAPAYMGPDLLEAPHDQVGTLLTAGLVQPNDTTVDKVKTDFVKTVNDCLVYDGKLYGYPLTLNTYAMIYNKDIVGEKGPETFQEIIDFAETFNNPSENKYALMWQVSSSYFSHCFIAGYGGYVFGNNGTNPNDIGLNTKEAIEGVTFFKSLKSILDVNSADTAYQLIDGLFASGKVAYVISGQWSVSQYEEEGMNIGVCPLPKMDNGSYPASYLGVQTLYVNAYTKYPNASKLFAEMASSEEMLKMRYEITKEVPAMTSIIESQEIKEDKTTLAFMEQAKRAVPMPSIPQMNLVWGSYQSALQSIWDSGTDPKAAMDKCVELITHYIQK
jgi:arabinogalactan oligomer/maltooligosaccharide transport system substrate-binding protein